MNPTQLATELESFGIVPVVQLANVDQGLRLAEVLIGEDLPVLEVTLRTEAGLAAIAAIRDNFPEILVGAGTLRTPEQVKQAIDAGANFGVSPGTNRPVLTQALQSGLPMIPGAITPTEIEALLDLEVELIKFFPAEAAGGVNYLKALSGPYPQVQFMPTGGISLSNLETYLSQSNVAACGGTWIATPALLAESNFEQIRKNVIDGLALTAQFRKSLERKK